MGKEDTVTDFSDKRLWKVLDTMDIRLKGIETLLTNVVRLEERMNGHEGALKRYGTRLDEHGFRIHEVEIWQATYGDKRTLDRALQSLRNAAHELTDRVDALEGHKDTTTGQKSIYREIVKYLGTFVLAYLIWKATGK